MTGSRHKVFGFFFLIAVLQVPGLEASTYSVLHSFQVPPEFPAGGIVQDDSGTLYGVSQIGPYTSATGAIFSVKKDGSRFSVLHTFFLNDPGGTRPIGPPVLDGLGTLFGMTESPVFSMRVDGTAFKVL